MQSVPVAQFFYVFYSVLNLFLISVCWSFLLEIFESGQSKRLFGIIAAGGTAGALAGPAVTYFAVLTVGNNGILFIGASLFILAIFFQRILMRIWTSKAAAQPGGVAAKDKAMGGNPFAGFTLVLRSPYLLGIALFVVFISTVSTLLYFEQMRLVELTFSDTGERTRVFAAIDGIVQGLTIVSQVFLTGRIASRLGLVVLLTIVPFAMIFGFVALAATGTFMALAVVMILRRAGEYAFVRPGREILWSRLDSESKYKAKNFIDVPIYRGADAVAAQVNSALGAAGLGPAAVALLGAGVAALWAVNGWWLGRQHDRETAQQPAVATHG
jgi:AAA family ATP:ADP antiporter